MVRPSHSTWQIKEAGSNTSGGDFKLPISYYQRFSEPINTMAKEQPPTPSPPPPYPGYPPPYVVYPPEEPIDWSEYWRVLVKNRKLIGIITAASTLIALLIAFLLPPIYRAEVLLAPVSEDKSESLSAIASQYGDLASLAGINLGTGKDKTDVHIGFVLA